MWIETPANYRLKGGAWSITLHLQEGEWTALLWIEDYATEFPIGDGSMELSAVLAKAQEDCSNWLQRQAYFFMACADQIEQIQGYSTRRKQ